MSQREVGERIGLTQSHVSDLERGRLDQISEERLLRILETYGELAGSGH
jgi:predicted XRE-type DNA-binding protein